jgi:hypothetical protein
MDETLYNRVEHADGRVEFIPKRAADLDWVPVEEGSTYFIVDTDGAPYGSTWDEDPLDDGREGFHNVFKTHQQAEKASALMRRSNAIIRACLLVDPEFVPDRGDGNQRKYSIYADGNGSIWVNEYTDNCYSSPAYVSTAEKALQVCQLLTKWGVV